MKICELSDVYASTNPCGFTATNRSTYPISSANGRLSKPAATTASESNWTFAEIYVFFTERKNSQTDRILSKKTKFSMGKLI